MQHAQKKISKAQKYKLENMWGRDKLGGCRGIDLFRLVQAANCYLKDKVHSRIGHVGPEGA
jgi:hypothetical protein